MRPSNWCGACLAHAATSLNQTLALSAINANARGAFRRNFAKDRCEQTRNIAGSGPKSRYFIDGVAKMGQVILARSAPVSGGENPAARITAWRSESQPNARLAQL